MSDGTDGALLNRDLQRLILLALAGEYPADILFPARTLAEGHEEDVTRNLMYLAGHDLVRVNCSPREAGDLPHIRFASITSKGLDFLADDGGLTAILGVVTVRLHEDSIRAVLLDRVARADAPEGVKEKLRSAIIDLPADGVKAAVPALLKQALDQAPDAIRLIGKWLGL